jgi:8-oxo-dGTP pyrophosphatase MutT (NUDIX family)
MTGLAWNADYLPLWIGGAIRGRVRGDVVPKLRAMPEIAVADLGLKVCEASDASAPLRSRALQRVAQRLRAVGLIADWRDEPSALLDERGEEVARCERGAFRTLGLQNRAVHVNGWSPDGRLWVARRSRRKRADPGKLDNLAAGGVGAGEAVRDCAVRELWEEAGVPASIAGQADFPGMAIRSLRETRFGVHDELVIVADLLLPEGFRPVGRDGEVESFACLPLEAVEAALAAGEFTVEAGLATRESIDRRRAPASRAPRR